MDRLFSGFKRGLWLAIVAGLIYSVISWGWSFLDKIANVLGVSSWVMVAILPVVLIVVGEISNSGFLPWLGAKLRNSIMGSVMRMFERGNSQPNPDSWVGEEVAIAIGDDCFCDGNVPNILKFGVVSAIRSVMGVDMVSVQLVYPPTGTGERMEIRQDSCQIRLTGGSLAEHAKMVSSLGRMCKDVTVLTGRSNLCTRGKGAPRNNPSVPPTSSLRDDTSPSQLSPEEVSARLSSAHVFPKTSKF